MWQVCALGLDPVDNRVCCATAVDAAAPAKTGGFSDLLGLLPEPKTKPSKGLMKIDAVRQSANKPAQEAPKPIQMEEAVVEESRSPTPPPTAGPAAGPAPGNSSSDEDDDEQDDFGLLSGHFGSKANTKQESSAASAGPRVSNPAANSAARLALAEAAAEPEPGPQPAPARAPAADVSPWSEATDPASGNPYYYNSQTGETSWQRPASFAAVAGPAAGPAANPYAAAALSHQSSQECHDGSVQQAGYYDQLADQQPVTSSKQKMSRARDMERQLAAGNFDVIANVGRKTEMPPCRSSPHHFIHARRRLKWWA